MAGACQQHLNERQSTMKLSTHFENFEPAQVVKDDFSELMLNAVERFQSRIRKLNVSVRDINGPKGGVDKKCRCVLHLKRMAPIVIEDTADNYLNLVNRVAERVSYTLSQKIDKVRKNSRARSWREEEADK